MKCTVYEAPTGNPLADAHLFAFHRVHHLYDDQDPRDIATYRARASAVLDTYSGSLRAALVDALRPYHAQIGASTAQNRALERLAQPDALAVVTGQQAGLFTGPIYSLAKALTAIGVARELERRLERPVVPVFWIASEDHDADEVNHAYVVDRLGEVARIQLPHRFEPHRMVYCESLTADDVRAVLSQADARLQEAEHKLEALHAVWGAWREGDSLATWFARLMAKLLGDHGLVFFDPCLPAIRRLAWPVFRNAILRVDEVQEALAGAYTEVEQAGFAPEVVRDPLHSTVFAVIDGKRFVLERGGPGLVARGHGEAGSQSDWLQRGESDPTGFSANVLLRPVVQDVVLPTLAYVGGPSEIAYYPLARGVFHAHGRRLPPLILRQRMRLIPPSVTRLLRKHDLTLEQLREPIDLVAGRVVADVAEPIRREVDEWMERVRAEIARLQEGFSASGLDLAGVLKRHVQVEERAWRDLERRVIRAWKRRRQDEIRQLYQIERCLFPDGSPQERRLCPLNAWIELGTDAFGALPTWSSIAQMGAVLDVVIDD
ncbi:bacillithiol biosynthesis cysteine-adding enzyme BshC [Alicyclobacillus vulcanalis]|uniref:Putative cysteine ligase BshC n=1 Tax=Alicyclobacillus vulcanalis TaxID=252246 RepID=A0A1N7NP35_9BACL|nr:bacillithiol biosynthesis cysteine-adding enzyme BshC [Alicyclobacillus vulcanalis]SIT00086.1 bacillithiol biosynthesis cysteine-adding enzyme BshC [Alicyclobacillus vulcanalis]